jgi:predicted neutral ceramidase superfamily lipid hydrolase
MKKNIILIADIVATLIVGGFFYLAARRLELPNDSGDRKTSFVMLGMIFPVAFGIFWGIYRITTARDALPGFVRKFFLERKFRSRPYWHLVFVLVIALILWVILKILSFIIEVT